MELKLTDIKPSQNRSRANYTDIPKLMSSIEANTMLQPIVVKKDGKGYRIVAGHRRYIAKQKLGHKTIRCTLFHGGGKTEGTIAQMAENRCRVDVSLDELGLSLGGLIKQGLTTAELAVKIGMSEREIIQALAAYRIIPKKFHQTIRRVSNNSKGVIGLDKANTIVAQTKTHGLTRTQISQLTENFGQESKHKIKVAATALKQGKSVASIQKNINNMAHNTMNLMLNTKKKIAWEKKHGVLFTKACMEHLKNSRKFGNVFI